MLVTVEELAAYMDLPRFDNRQEIAAGLVLEGLQSEVETIIRRPVEIGTYTEQHRVSEDFLSNARSVAPSSDGTVPYADPAYVLPLANSPVVTISEVRLNPYPQTEDGWTVLTANVDYAPRPWGIDVYGVKPNDDIEVTYDGGLDGPAIPFFKISILRAAGREMAEQTDDVVGISDLGTRPPQTRQTGFTQDEIKVMQRWKRRQIAWT